MSRYTGDLAPLAEYLRQPYDPDRPDLPAREPGSPTCYECGRHHDGPFPWLRCDAPLTEEEIRWERGTLESEAAIQGDGPADD